MAYIARVRAVAGLTLAPGAGTWRVRGTVTGPEVRQCRSLTRTLVATSMRLRRALRDGRVDVCMMLLRVCVRPACRACLPPGLSGLRHRERFRMWVLPVKQAVANVPLTRAYAEPLRA